MDINKLIELYSTAKESVKKNIQNLEIYFIN